MAVRGGRGGCDRTRAAVRGSEGAGEQTALTSPPPPSIAEASALAEDTEDLPRVS